MLVKIVRDVPGLWKWHTYEAKERSDGKLEVTTYNGVAVINKTDVIIREKDINDQ